MKRWADRILSLAALAILALAVYRFVGPRAPEVVNGFPLADRLTLIELSSPH